MHHPYRALAASVVFGLLGIVTSAIGGRENVLFPAYQTHVLYDVLDQPELKEIREAYINPEALKDFRPGEPFPSGTVLTLPTFKALLDDAGELVRDPNGHLVLGPLDRIVVMEKRTGWGAEYPEELRNGEWEYERFRPNGARDQSADIPGCFKCHKPKSELDFVFTLPQIVRFSQR